MRNVEGQAHAPLACARGCASRRQRARSRARPARPGPAPRLNWSSHHSRPRRRPRSCRGGCWRCRARVRGRATLRRRNPNLCSDPGRLEQGWRKRCRNFGGGRVQRCTIRPGARPITRSTSRRRESGSELMRCGWCNDRECKTALQASSELAAAGRRVSVYNATLLLLGQPATSVDHLTLPSGRLGPHAT